MGGAFQSQYPESNNTGSSVTEEANILNTIVSDYNQSRNPGKFSVRYEGQDRFSITGTSVKDDSGISKQVESILDIPISMPVQTKDSMATLELLSSNLTVQSGTKVFAGLLPANILVHSTVVSDGQKLPARTLLQQILSATGQKLYWDLFYDTNVKAYYLSLAPVKRTAYDKFGNRSTVFVK